MTDTTPLPLLLSFAALAWIVLGLWIVAERRSARRRVQERHLATTEHGPLPADLNAQIRELSADPSWYDADLARSEGAEVFTHKECALFAHTHDHIVSTLRTHVGDAQEQTWRVERIAPPRELATRLCDGVHVTGIALVQPADERRQASDDADHGPDDLKRFHALNRTDSEHGNG